MNPPRKTTAAVGFGLRVLFRLLGWSLSAALALIALLYFAIPALLRFGVPHALSRYGIVSSIESARVDIAEEKITLTGFNIGPRDGPGIRWGEVVALVDMTALMKGNIRIIDIRVKDARVDLRQLAASEWGTAMIGSEIGAKPQDFDVGEAVIRDLEFVGLSEKLGRPVSLRSLRVGSLSRLNRGDQVAFELEAELGEAKLNLTGIAAMRGDLPVVEGRYELGAFTLRGLAGALDMAGTTSLTGRADGAGTFSLRYQPEGALVKADISGRLAVSNLTVERPEFALTEAGVDWDGTVEIDWPISDRAPTVRADGRAAAGRVVAGSKPDVESVQFESEGLHWDGEMEIRDSVSLKGRIGANAVRVAGSGKTGNWRFDSNGMVLEGVRRTEDGGIRIGTGDAGETRVTLVRGEVEHAATLSSVSFSNLQSGRDDYTVESLAVDSARSPAATTPDATWRLTGLGTGGIRLSGTGALSIASLNLAGGQIGLSGAQVSVTDARATNIEGSADAAWKVDGFNVSSLQHRAAGTEIWGTGLTLADARLDGDGGIAVDSISADRLRQLSADTLDWEIASLEAGGVSGTTEAIHAKEATASSVTYRVAESGELEIDGAELSAGSYTDDAGARASEVRFETVRYRSGDISTLELTRTVATAPAYREAGTYLVESVRAEELRYADEAANANQFRKVSVSGVEGDVNTGIRIRSASVDEWHHDSTTNADFNGQGLTMSTIDASLQGEVQAERGKLDGLTVSFADGAEVSVTGLSVDRPAVQPGFHTFAAAGAKAREFGFNHGAGRRLSADHVAAGRLEPRDEAAYHLTFLRAMGIDAVDEVIGTRLETGPVSMETLTTAADGRIDIGSGVLERVSLTDSRSTPAASFSAREITLENAGIDPGKLIDLGRMRIDDVDVVAGFSEFSRFVLPQAPFSGGADESTAALAVARLETRGECRLSFFDRSTSPPFELALAPASATLENYHGGDPAARARFTVEGKIDEFSSLKVDGAVSGKGDGINLELEGEVTGFDLTRLNTYAEKHTRSTLSAGRGDASFDLKIAGQKLTGDTRFVFSKVKFNPAADAPTTDQTQDLSLESSFAMLKDKEDIVRVSVPLSGSLDDPQFDFSDAVIQSVIKTVQNTVMLTFKPLGLLVSVAGLVGIGDGLRFNPVSFAAGEATLTGQTLSYLDTLAAELKKRPRVELKICGRAVPADLIATDKSGATGGLAGAGESPSELTKLAESRATVVRQYLEQEKGIDPARLRACPAKVETTAGSLPRAEMLVQVEGRTPPAAAESRAKGTAN